MLSFSKVKGYLLKGCDFALRSMGIMIPMNELPNHPGTYVAGLVMLFLYTVGGSYFTRNSIKYRMADNIVRGTGFDEAISGLAYLQNIIITLVAIYFIYKVIKAYAKEIAEPFTRFSKWITKVNKGETFLTRCFKQVMEHPTGLAALSYQFTKISSKADLIANLTILSSLLKLPQNIWETALGQFQRNNVAIEGQEEMLDDVTNMLALGLTVTKTKIGDVDLGNFIVNVDKNQRACENIVKRITPLLVKLKLVKDSNYEVILEVAEEVKQLIDDEAWIKVLLKTNPNELLTTANSVRVSKLQKRVALLRNKMNTLTSKELRSDKVVSECHKILATLETLFIEVSVLEQANMTRVKPVGVCIQGAKQIGKTNLVDILTKKVTEYVKANGGLSFRNAPAWNTWCIQSRDEFDTGYFGQEITYDDDAFQQKDNKDHQRWFTFISNSPVGTNQADLKQKGLLYKSKLVFATCNNLPVKSITVEDITALHARFPHTICLKRNDKPMPKGDRSEAYDWVDIYYGTMENAVSSTSTTSPSGDERYGSLRKKTLQEVVELIGNDLIIQDRYYNSCIVNSATRNAVEGTEQVCDDTEIKFLEEDDVISNNIIKALNEFGGLKTNEMVNSNVSKEMLPSIRMWMIYKSLKWETENFVDWYTRYLEKMRKIYLEVGSFFDEDVEKKLLTSALTQCLIFKTQTTEQVIESHSWKNVLPWVLSLKHSVSQMNFVDHMDKYPMTFDQFLMTLGDWKIVDMNKFNSYYSQKALNFISNGKMFTWYPLLQKGSMIIPVTADVRVVRSRIIEKDIYARNNPSLTPLDLKAIQALFATRIMASGIDGVKGDIEALYMHFKSNVLNYTFEETCYVASLESLIKSDSRIRQEVQDEIVAGVKSRYAQVTEYYTRLTRNGMGNLIALLARLGIPINDHWNELLIDKAPVITAATVSVLTSLLVLTVVKFLQYGVDGEEQSRGEKRPKQKKIITSKLQKFRKVAGREEAQKFIDGCEQGEWDVFDSFYTRDLGDNNEINLNYIEDLIEYTTQAPDVLISGYGYNTDKSGMNFNTYWSAIEDYKDELSNPERVLGRKVISYRYDGSRKILFTSDGKGDVNELFSEVEYLLEKSNYYPKGEWIFDIWTKRDDDNKLLYTIELTLLNAKSQGGFVGWTRADVKNIMDVQNLLNGGNIVDVKSIIMGVQQSAPQAYEVSNAILRNHSVKLNCVNKEELNIISMKGLQVYGLASTKLIILPAHAVRTNRWIRFTRAKSDQNTFGVARVDDELIDYQRDIAVARILSRYEAEEKMSKEGFYTALTNISKQDYKFPNLEPHLLSAEQQEVEWMNCTTLHYFASNSVYALGTTTSFEVMSYEITPNTFESKKLAACVQNMRSECFLSQKGDCGSPVVIATGKRAGKLLGFHAYLSPNKYSWYSSVLTTDDLAVITGGEQAFADPWQKLIMPGKPVDLPQGPEVEFLGVFPRPSLPVTNDSLDHWHKSPFASQFVEQLAPGRLNPYDPYIENPNLPRNLEGRKSLLLGPNNAMAKTLPDLDQNILDWCVTQLIEERVAMFKAQDTLRRVSDNIDEMIDYAMNGHPDNSFVKGMEVNKAAGIPWSLNGTPKKSDFITVDEQTGRREWRKNANGEALRKRLTLKIEQAKIGNRILSFSSSKLKDQPIKIAQAKSGRTRVFHCIPVDMIMFQACLYGPYKEAFTKAGLKAYHAVGIDPKSVAWSELASYLSKHPNYFDADYTNYDKYLHRQMYKAVRKLQRSIIQQICPDSWDLARAVEELDAIDTIVVDYQTVYKTNRANKSGSYTTTIDNCDANDLYGLYAWVKTTNVWDLYEYRTNVSTVSFGDDIVKSVSDEYKDKYNYCTYRDVLNETGHIITPGSKDGKEVPFTAFENLQFLKRGFVMQDGMVIAPLLKRSIEGPFVWTDIREDQVTVWVNLVHEQLLEACLWGEEYYDEFRNKLKCGDNRALNDALAALLATSWTAMFAKFHSRYYGLKE